MKTTFEELSEMANVGMEIEQSIRLFNNYKQTTASTLLRNNWFYHKIDIYNMCIVRLEQRKQKQLELIKQFINK